MNVFFFSTPWIVFSVAVFTLGFIWYYRVVSLAENFLKVASKLISDAHRRKGSGTFFYQKDELTGTYKGREVVIGIEHTGIKGEFLALPCIQMKLKDAMSYNLNRLPHYAVVEKKMIIYKIKLNVLWGIFDKNYPQVFSQGYLIVGLERLLATAEDLERGRLAKEQSF